MKRLNLFERYLSVGAEEERLEVFRKVRDELLARLSAWLAEKRNPTIR